MKKRVKKPLSEYSTGELVLYRFRKNKLAMLGVAMFLFVTLMILIAPLIRPYDMVVKQNIADRLQGPSSQYLFGTDELGRDLFSRILYGGRISLFCSLAIIAIAFVSGALIGGAAGFFGGKVDTVLMRIVDMLMSVPSALLAMAIITALGNGVWKLVLALSIGQIPRFARMVRSSVITLRNMEYVEAARCFGISSMKIMLKHILPNIASALVVNMTLNFPGMILLETSLSFLGVGVQPPMSSLGTMLGFGRDYLTTAWWIAVVPGVTIVISTLSMSVLGDWVQQKLEPQSR